MQPTLGITLGGILPAMSLSDTLEQQRREAEATQATPLLRELAAHIRRCWTLARTAKEQTVEPRMFKSLRARRGEYDPDVLTKIRETGGSEIYMMLTSVKCRAASSWLRDTLLGTGSEKPWSIRPTKDPSVAPDQVEEIRQQAIGKVQQILMQTGELLEQGEIRQMLQSMKTQVMSELREQAKRDCQQMEDKMEDQLQEGRFIDALSQFLDDVTTFPAAFIKGPIIRRKPSMQWVQQPDGSYLPDVKDALVTEWERVDPFMVYPSPGSTGVNDGFLIERHKLRQQDLEELIGVEGYDDGAIRSVLDEYGRGGLQEWLIVDSTKAQAEGRSTTAVMNNAEHLIDALQFWGTVPGQMLLDWGMSEDEVQDPAKQYHCEAWLIGSRVIKATLNYHPLGEKPYYKASYEELPGTFWGNSVCDLVRDCQEMCNSSARALANNMGISSGPQVWVNVDRLASGEDVTNMYPWKIWQMASDQFGQSGAPVEFFQPQSNAQELMLIFEKFSILADEFSGVPRYMTGGTPTGGAGRTASGMSMLMGNASKTIKQVVMAIDTNVLKPLLERLWFHNMKYGEDRDLKRGDIAVVARGATSIVAKESAQIRRNEFLAATANPIDMQIIGMPGRAAVLREAAKTLDMNVDDIVPDPDQVKLMQEIQQKMQMMQQLQSPQQAQAMQQGATPPKPSEETLQNGAPTTDNFSPNAMTPA